MTQDTSKIVIAVIGGAFLMVLLFILVWIVYWMLNKPYVDTHVPQLTRRTSEYTG